MIIACHSRQTHHTHVFVVIPHQGPMKMMQDGFAKHGEVFTVPLLTRNFTFLLDPHVSGHFFKASDDEMSQYEVIGHIIYTGGISYRAYGAVDISQCHISQCYISQCHISQFNITQCIPHNAYPQVYNFNIPTFGPGVVYDVDIKVRNEQFRWLGEALKGKKLLSYIPGFVKEAQVCRIHVE